MFRFESVNYRAKVWLNGKPLGAHVGSVPALRGARRKSVKRGGGSTGWWSESTAGAQKFDIPPLSQRASGSFEGGWWNYTGILREVYLRRVKNLDLEDVFVRPRLRCPHCAAIDRPSARVTISSRGLGSAAKLGGGALDVVAGDPPAGTGRLDGREVDPVFLRQFPRRRGGIDPAGIVATGRPHRSLASRAPARGGGTAFSRSCGFDQGQQVFVRERLVGRQNEPRPGH